MRQQPVLLRGRCTQDVRSGHYSSPTNATGTDAVRAEEVECGRPSHYCIHGVRAAVHAQHPTLEAVHWLNLPAPCVLLFSISPCRVLRLRGIASNAGPTLHH